MVTVSSGCSGADEKKSFVVSNWRSMVGEERHDEQEVENTVLKFKYENCFLASPWINLEINLFS